MVYKLLLRERERRNVRERDRQNFSLENEIYNSISRIVDCPTLLYNIVG